MVDMECAALSACAEFRSIEFGQFLYTADTLADLQMSVKEHNADLGIATDGDADRLGIVDENPSLQKLNVYGFPVLGASQDLEKLYEKRPFDTIVLTTANISSEIINRLRDFAAAHEIRLTMFLAQEYPADLELFKMLQAKAINPIEEERADDNEQDDPGLGL